MNALVNVRVIKSFFYGHKRQPSIYSTDISPHSLRRQECSRQRTLLVEGFLLPHLVQDDLNPHLRWINEDDCTFSMSRIHGSKACWTVNDAIVSIVSIFGVFESSQLPCPILHHWKCNILSVICISVYFFQLWSKLKNLWKEGENKGVVKAKHRLACAMRKHKNIVQIDKPDNEVHFQFVMKKGER